MGEQDCTRPTNIRVNRSVRPVTALATIARPAQFRPTGYAAGYTHGRGLRGAATFAPSRA